MTRTCIESATSLASNLAKTRSSMLGTEDEHHYWDCQAAADVLLNAVEELKYLRKKVLDKAKDISYHTVSKKSYGDRVDV